MKKERTVSWFTEKQLEGLESKFAEIDQEDLNAMYETVKDKIMLWADARVATSNGPIGQKRKCDNSYSFMSKRQHIEAEIDSTVAELKEKQGDSIRCLN